MGATRSARRVSDAAEPFALELRGDWQGAPRAGRYSGVPPKRRVRCSPVTRNQFSGKRLPSSSGSMRGRPRPLRAAGCRRRGAQGIPLGYQPATRSHPAKLTARGIEVLALMTEGITNTETVGRL